MLGWKTFAAMPFWKRFLVGVPIALVCFWAALSLQAKVWTEAMKMAVEEQTGGEVETENSFFTLKGAFGVEGVRFTMPDPAGEEDTTYKVDRITVETPGLGWYALHIFSNSADLPDHVGVVVENPRNVATDPNTPGNYSNLPFDAMGCVAEALTPTDLRAMDVRTDREIRVALDKVSNTDTMASFRLRNPDAGEMEMQVGLELKRPVDLEAFDAAMLQQMGLKSVQVRFNDLGFIAKRNAYCAKKHGLTAAAFTEYHMQEVARFNGARGTSMGQGTLAQYRDFAEHGGRLELRTAGTRTIPLDRFVRMTRMQQMQAYPLMIAANGKAPANFAFNAGLQPAAQPAAPAAAEGAVAVPVANVAPAAAGALPEPGAIVPYAQLPALVGQHVEITTTYGSVRKGVVTLAGSLESSVQLDKEEGGMLLHLPADSITQIRYTPVAPPATQAIKAN